MKIQYKARNVELSDALKGYVDRKLEKLSRIINNEDAAEIEAKFEKEHERTTVEMTFKLRSIIVRSKETTKDFYASIDNAVDTIEKRLKRFKEKSRTLKRERAEEIQPEAETEEPQRVVKVKRFPLTPIDVDEAIMQMEMLDHEFFVFRNSDGEKVNVIYKRKNGDYGLIVPQ